MSKSEATDARAPRPDAAVQSHRPSELARVEQRSASARAPRSQRWDADMNAWLCYPVSERDAAKLSEMLRHVDQRGDFQIERRGHVPVRTEI